jgi:glycosyltransferase involved in cell wall biosynthesis
MCNLSKLISQQALQCNRVGTGWRWCLKKSLNPGITIRNLERRNKWNLFTLLRLSKELRSFDVIHIHMRHVYRYVFLANLAARKTLILHDHFNYFPNTFLQKAIFKTLLIRHIYISVDKMGYNWAADVLNLPHKNVFCLPNVIIKERVYAQAKTNKIVLVSNIKPEKNIAFIIPFAQQLLNQHSTLEIDVVGSVLDQGYFEEISNQLKSKSFSNRITFITNETAVQSRLSQYQLGLHFSKLESGPLVLLEYLAQGLPFISYYTGEIAKRLEIELPLFFLSGFNVAAWCKRADEIMQGSVQYANLSVLLEKHNNSEDYFEQCQKIYQRIHS